MVCVFGEKDVCVVEKLDGANNVGAEWPMKGSAVCRVDDYGGWFAETAVWDRLRSDMQSFENF